MPGRTIGLEKFTPTVPKGFRGDLFGTTSQLPDKCEQIAIKAELCTHVVCVIDSTSTAAGSAGELPHSQSASDLQESTRLPLVIRERDVEYQVRGRVVCM